MKWQTYLCRLKNDRKTVEATVEFFVSRNILKQITNFNCCGKHKTGSMVSVLRWQKSEKKKLPILQKHKILLLILRNHTKSNFLANRIFVRASQTQQQSIRNDHRAKSKVPFTDHKKPFATVISLFKLLFSKKKLKINFPIFTILKKFPNRGRYHKNNRDQFDSCL